MSTLNSYMDHIKEEIEGAKYYAQKYVENKNVNAKWANMYNEMAKSELSHSEYLTAMAKSHYDNLAWRSERTVEDWEHCLAWCAEEAAIVRLMLAS